MTELLAGELKPKESDKSVQACNDWLRLGPGRTIPLLYQQYEFLPKNSCPTKSVGTLYKWHQAYGWKARASQFDATWEAFKNAEHLGMIQMGLSLTHERLRRLMRLGALLESQIYELDDPNEDGISSYPNVWLHDVKQIGNGDKAERVDIERFNVALISEYRAVLDDIAKEVGGRKQKAEVEHKGSIIFKTGMNMDDI